jgi:hypothetical protein
MSSAPAVSGPATRGEQVRGFAAQRFPKELAGSTKMIEGSLHYDGAEQPFVTGTKQLHEVAGFLDGGVKAASGRRDASKASNHSQGVPHVPS